MARRAASSLLVIAVCVAALWAPAGQFPVPAPNDAATQTPHLVPPVRQRRELGGLGAFALL
eukprot:4256104-Alexandrium_andersonii.AAC.1